VERCLFISKLLLNRRAQIISDTNKVRFYFAFIVLYINILKKDHWFKKNCPSSVSYNVPYI